MARISYLGVQVPQTLCYCIIDKLGGRSVCSAFPLENRLLPLGAVYQTSGVTSPESPTSLLHVHGHAHRYALTAAGLQQLALANPSGVHLGSGRKHALAIGSYAQELSDRAPWRFGGSPSIVITLLQLSQNRFQNKTHFLIAFASLASVKHGPDKQYECKKTERSGIYS